MIKHLFLVAGMAFMPFACSDEDEQTEEPVQMPGDEDAMADPAMPDGADLGATDSPSMNDLTGGTDAMGSSMGSGGYGAGLFVRPYVLRIRSGPGISHKTIGYVTFNQEVVPAADANPSSFWLKVGEGQYISRKYLNNEKNQQPHLPSH